MLPMALHLIGLSVVLCISRTFSTPLPLQPLLEGSTDEDELSNSIPITSTLATTNLSDFQTTPGGPARGDTNFLGEAVNFLQENLFLILVVTTIALAILLVICGAILMSRRHKVNAYYPSSFPSKMYVDHKDKTGGVRLFNEVPEKPAPEQESEPLDSHKQLQEDIMRAAKSLRAANKSVDVAEGNDPSQKVDQSSEGSFKADGSIREEEISNVPEEEKLCQLTDHGAAPTDSSSEPIHPEQAQPQPEDPQDEPSCGRSLRPSSLHLHGDSAKLQLIAGEKTAF
ncbi:transmembrane protein 119b [Thalassophryne amazonica]|uniref:transmembrane protein 119b n=1 Tax=Thalassophryne amazonica TaxID=390379 RepID=UPI0014710901|nr:transmembrane protein 119b [Thalassophryne amazonica]